MPAPSSGVLIPRNFSKILRRWASEDEFLSSCRGVSRKSAFLVEEGLTELSFYCIAAASNARPLRRALYSSDVAKIINMLVLCVNGEYSEGAFVPC